MSPVKGCRRQPASLQGPECTYPRLPGKPDTLTISTSARYSSNTSECHQEITGTIQFRLPSCSACYWRGQDDLTLLSQPLVRIFSNLLKIFNQFIIKKIKSFCVSEIGRRQSIYSWQFLFKIIAEALVKSTTVFVIGIHTHNVSAKFHKIP